MPAASVRAAVGFLTRIPVGRVDGADVARGAFAFPLVGAGIGAVGAGVALVVHPALSPPVAAALAVAAMTALTGALHLDGLADTADALGGGSRERALEIMRDSRIGSFGAAAVGLDLLLRVTVIAQLLGGAVVGPLVAAGALSRASSVVLSALLPYPRENGTGSVLSSRVSSSAAGVIGVAVVVVALRGDAAFVAGAVALTTIVLGLAFWRWLGGATGDALGAASEVGEIVALLVAAGLR